MHLYPSVVAAIGGERSVRCLMRWDAHMSSLALVIMLFIWRRKSEASGVSQLCSTSDSAVRNQADLPAYSDKTYTRNRNRLCAYPQDSRTKIHIFSGSHQIGRNKIDFPNATMLAVKSGYFLP